MSDSYLEKNKRKLVRRNTAVSFITNTMLKVVYSERILELSKK